MTPMQDHPSDWPWDHLPGTLVPVLAEAMTQQFAFGPIYLLIDPFFSDFELSLDRQGQPHARYDVPGEGLRPPADKLPYLVELKGVNDPLFEQSLQWAAHEHLAACVNGNGAYGIGGWLQPHGAIGGTELARQLGGLFKASGEPNGSSYLRLADRRVLALLQHAPQLSAAMPDAPTLRPIDWAQQLQGIAAWVYLDANFALQRLSGRMGEAGAGPLRLDDAHWRLLGDAEAIHRSLMAWQGTQHPLPDTALTQVAQVLVRARRHGLRTAEDCAAYAAEALRFPAFESWPDLSDRIARSLSTGQPLADRLVALRGQWAGPAA